MGGRCPWIGIGIGQDYVALAKPQWRDLVVGTADPAREVRRPGFTTLPSKVGKSLADTLQLS